MYIDFAKSYYGKDGLQTSKIADEFQKRGWPIRVSMTWLYINCDLQHVNKGTAINRLLTETGNELPKHIAIGIPDQCPTNAVDLVLDDASLIYRSFANELFQLAISEGSRRTPEMKQELTSFLVLSGYHN